MCSKYFCPKMFRPKFYRPKLLSFHVSRPIFLLQTMKLHKKYVEIYKPTQHIACVLTSVRHSVY